MRIFPGFLNRDSTPKPISLANIRIASACPAEWAKMIGNEQVRHCSECNLNVYNLSAMNQKDVERLLAGNRGERLCTRFYRRADGTVLTQDCLWSLRAAARKVSRLATAILTAVLSVNFAAAKSKPKQATCDCQQIQQKDSGIQLTVMDQNGAVIPNADVTLEDKSDKGKITGSTSPSGEWSQAKLATGQYVLAVKSQGFRTFNSSLNVRDGILLGLKVTLPVANVNTTVTVRAESMAMQGATVGMLMAQEPVSLPAGFSGGQPAPMRR
jgi:carboxypeptidase family protein